MGSLLFLSVPHEVMGQFSRGPRNGCGKLKTKLKNSSSKEKVTILLSWGTDLLYCFKNNFIPMSVRSVFLKYN